MSQGESDFPIVSYDARLSMLSLPPWNIDRREMYLFRLDVVVPLSVDSQVWPSVIGPQAIGGADHVDVDSVNRGSLHEVVNALCLPNRSPPLPSVDLIAITTRTSEVSNDIPPLIPDNDLVGISPTWTFLGYDVADQCLLSALSNCGFVDEVDDTPILRREWGARLNCHHLFYDFNDAVRFKEFSDVRLRGYHDPCFVFALWVGTGWT